MLVDINRDGAARNRDRPRGNPWAVYRRLLGYAFQHKARLLVSIMFALVVALSFTAMLVGIGGVVQIVFGDEEQVLARAPQYAEMVEENSVLHFVFGLFEAPELPPGEPFPLDPSRAEAHVYGLILAMQHNRMTALMIGCGIILGLTLLAGAARYVQEYFAGTIGAAISVQLAQEMFDNIIHCSLSFFERHPTGSILARLTNDVFRVNAGLSVVFVKVVREPVKMLFFLYVALRADWLLTLVGLCVLPPVIFLIVKLGNKFKRRMGRSLEKIASLAAMSNEIVSGIMIVKGFSMEDYESERARGELDKLRYHLNRMVRTNALLGPLVEGTLIAGLVAFVLFLGYRVVYHELAPGPLVVLVGALAMMMDPVRKLSAVNNLVMGSVASAERVFEFIDVKPDIVEKRDAVELPRMRESIRFEDVAFSYDGKETVLNNIDLDIRKGEMVALVGFSGSGKSTLVKLVPRFYDPTAGRITVDGIDLRDVTFHSLRRQISIVSQDTVLFNQTVAENIAFGLEDATPERIREAARAANADDFIQRLPGGYDAVIGEHGGSLSGGQRQRLAIARALLRDPAILILDEATSSLDSESERAIQKAIDEFAVGRTSIVIAHRLSTIHRADRIIVLQNGRIAQQGSHEELLQLDGLYRRLYQTQFETA
jgi:subfamily B ATP-binding cassette protein MsbA